MTQPEDALALARARAALARERGGYAGAAPAEVEPVDAVSLEQLLEWAIIDPDFDEIRSTRRFGGPITFVKRALAHAMRQYNNQLIAQQQRFNIQLALYVAQLAERADRRED